MVLAGNADQTELCGKSSRKIVLGSQIEIALDRAGIGACGLVLGQSLVDLFEKTAIQHFVFGSGGLDHQILQFYNCIWCGRLEEYHCIDPL